MDESGRDCERSLSDAPLLIVVNGGYRTGSTVIFNIVREIYRATGTEFDSWLADSPAEVEAEILKEAERPRVIKCHVWIPLGARDLPFLRTIHSIRDPVDVMASFLRMQKGWNLGLAEIQRQALLSLYHRHPPVSVVNPPLILDYDHYYYYPLPRVRLISEYLGIPLSSEQERVVLRETSIARSQEIANALDPGTQDQETLLQGGHIGSHFQGEPGSGEKVIGAPAAQKVREAVRIATSIPEGSPC